MVRKEFCNVFFGETYDILVFGGLLGLAVAFELFCPSEKLEGFFVKNSITSRGRHNHLIDLSVSRFESYSIDEGIEFDDGASVDVGYFSIA